MEVTTFTGGGGELIPVVEVIPTYLPTYLPAYLPAYLPTCLPAQHTHARTHARTKKFVYLSTHIH